MSDADVALRSGWIVPGGEGAATGSEGRYNASTQIFVRASKDVDRITNVRVGGYAVPIMEGTATSD